MLSTLALFWDSIELPIHPAIPDPDDEERAAIERLIEHGVVRLHQRTLSRSSFRRASCPWARPAAGARIGANEVGGGESQLAHSSHPLSWRQSAEVAVAAPAELAAGSEDRRVELAGSAA